jgi:DNA-binding NarL/FixJ family response regulator
LKDEITTGARRLTPRERQVLSRIAGGKTSKAIAAELEISLHTVKTYREKLAQKLGVSSIAALTRYAIENQIDGDG